MSEDDDRRGGPRARKACATGPEAEVGVEVVEVGPGRMAPARAPIVALWRQEEGAARLRCPAPEPPSVPPSEPGSEPAFETVALAPGDLWLRDAAQEPRLLGSGAAWRAVDLRLTHGLLAEVARAEMGRPQPPAPPGRGRLLRDPALAALALSAIQLARDPRADPLTRAALGRALAARLLGRHLVPASPGRSMDRRFERVLAHVERHLDGPIRLEALAEEAGLSVFHFSRVFRARLGTTPQQHVRARRVARARRLLAGTDLALAEIAYACGFAHQSHFTALFRAHTGRTPGAFRAEAARDDGGSAAEP